MVKSKIKSFWIKCPKENDKRRSAIKIFNENIWAMEIVCKSCGSIYAENRTGGLTYFGQIATRKIEAHLNKCRYEWYADGIKHTCNKTKGHKGQHLCHCVKG